MKILITLLSLFVVLHFLVNPQNSIHYGMILWQNQITDNIEKASQRDAVILVVNITWQSFGKRQTLYKAGDTCILVRL